MAALRSGMAILGRRCSAGSSSTASMSGKGMEILQVFRRARAPQPLHPAAVRNLESWRRFSTRAGEPKDKTESVPRKLWQWAKYRAENASPLTKSAALFAYGAVVMGTPTLYTAHNAKNWAI